MVATTSRPRPDAPPDHLVRFDRAERWLHWTNAALFLTLVGTGAALYVGPLSTLVGRRELVKTIHVWCGLALPVPVVLSLASKRVRRDLGRLNRWAPDDWRWLRSFGRDRRVRLGKFNPGQKLNAAFVGGAIFVMLATGSIMRWFSHFSDDWRTGATFVHDWMFLALIVVIVGHITFALRDGDSLRAMVRGWIPARWARRHAPRWLAEERPEAPEAPES
jgi:formate dehydrogenase subunit gamma